MEEVHIILEIILIISFVGVIFFQSFYIFSILEIIFKIKKSKQIDCLIKEKISIIIPVFNSEKTIDRCFNSILQNNLSSVKSLIIVLDHCDDNSSVRVYSYINKFKTRGVEFLILNLPERTSGKVNAIKYGISFVDVKNIFLLDADIMLTENAIIKLLHFHLSNNNSFSSCLVYPYQKDKHSFVSNLICQDRLYRQNIIKIVKNKYGVANFPGSIGIVNTEQYKKFLFSGFLEDLTASFHILGVKEKIAIMPLVLAYEFERETLKGLFLQRARWSIGTIENMPLLIKTVILEKDILKKILITSYPLMWYVQHYFIVTGIFLILFSSLKLIWIFPLVLYFVQIIISNISAKKKYDYKILEIISHCLIFPIVITGALIGGALLILKNKKFYFKDSILFKRI